MGNSSLNSLPEIEAAIWRELQAASHTRGHAWRTAVLATREGDGADARTVVLRDVDEATRTLLIYTDARSPKAQQMVAHPQGTLVMWSATMAWQLRLRVRLQLQTDGLALTSRWARLKLTPAAQDYLSPLAPGSTLASPLPSAPPTSENRNHFAMIAAVVQSIDWLELDPAGHRRAVFEDDRQRWVAP